MKIFFIGTVKFSFDALNALIRSGSEVVGVATREDTAMNSDYKDLRPLCDQFNLPYKIVNDINHPNNISFIKQTNPDVIYCFGWSNLLKTELLTLAPKGVVGFHPAHIPHNKGRHPIIWALCLGLKTTASSFFFMDEGADTGDILSQEIVPITEDDDAASLYDKLTNIAIEQILDFTISLAKGTNNRIRQLGTGNTWRKRGRRDGEIDFRMPSKNIFNLVRALAKPYIGAHLVYNNQEVKVWKTEMSNLGQANDEPGKVLDRNDHSFTVKTGDGAITILEHELENIPRIGNYI
ncbi:methionyl-tRNA formyltransferase [Pedobacter helvus]|uniref:Methionyl-tRNA formyltransferase n=1 Tax=Pedobacter helvus TaxID=2563444 RepID=A0ABW9JHV6_9SPHI|nr:formyltransferase family protein [Pedobacter ureilyticus]